MASWALPVLTAIREVCEGSVGSVRTVVSDTMLSGLHTGMADARKATLALVKPRFDVQPVAWGKHVSTPSVKGTVAIREIQLNLLVSYHLEITDDLNQAEKEAIRATVFNNAETIRQALTFPGNLTQTASATSTGLVSGLLEEIGEFKVIREDFAAHILDTSQAFRGLVQLTTAIT